jgi:hypothetical protein
MNIVVCVKQVPDTEAERTLRPEGAENPPHLGKCLAEHGWAFGVWPACGACRVG